MPLDERSLYGIAAAAAVSALIFSCVASPTGESQPTTGGPPAAGGTSGTAPASAPLTPDAASAVDPQPSAMVDVIVPAGAIIKLQKGLRTQSTVPPADFSAADLARLVVQLNGRTLTAADYTITGLHYDDRHQLVLTIRFTPPPATPTPVRVATADGSVALLGLTSATGEPARIDSRSTARFLMSQLLVQPRSDEDYRLFEQAIEKTVRDGWTSSLARPIDTDAALVGLMQRISTFILTGRPLTPEALARIVAPPSGSGGGGGGSQAPSPPSGSSSGSGGDSSGGDSGSNGGGDSGSSGSSSGSDSGSEPPYEGSSSGGDPNTSGGGSSGGPPPED